MRKKELLSEKQKDEILAILSVGCSRKTAAQYAGVTQTVIKNTAKEDEVFAERLLRAQEMAEITSMKNISNAARQERYWKAAAWILERKNPEEYRLRSPGTFNAGQLKFILGQLTQIIVDEVKSPAYRKRILSRMDAMLKEING
ncbi:MAG: hypothetical protein Q4D98_02360 [Planctomycetia bacterium]|nr:hypothetical protein [Planctomycetia bacterium]